MQFAAVADRPNGCAAEPFWRQQGPITDRLGEDCVVFATRGEKNGHLPLPSKWEVAKVRYMKSRAEKSLKRLFVTVALAAGLGMVTVGCVTTGGGSAVPPEKMAELEKAATGGDAAAMLKLGDAHNKNKDYTKATMWYDKAAASYNSKVK